MSIIFRHNHDNLYLIHHTRDEQPCNENFKIHSHEMNELLYIISGEGNFFVEGREYPITPNCIYIMKPGETHRMNISENMPYERISIHFSSSILSSIDSQEKLLDAFRNRDIGTLNCYTKDILSSELVYTCLDNLSTNISKKQLEDTYNIRLILLSYLLPILSEINSCFYTHYLKEDYIEEKNTIRLVIEYINNNLIEDLSLDTLSDIFFISKSYLNTQFKETTGTTIWNYIIIKRLAIARAQIQNGISIKKAFTNSGFSDYSSFYRRYISRFGVSPSEDKPEQQKSF